MENQYKIYCLKEPELDEIRYIGLTKHSLKKRLSWHIGDIYRNTTHKTNWINSLLNNNKKPVIELIEDNLTLEQALQKEIFYIKFFKSIGTKLTNSTEGGEFYVKMTDEIKLKMNLGYRNSLMKGLKNNNSKPVLQIEKVSNKVLAAFENIAIATTLTEMTKSGIYDYIQGRDTYGGGYDWKVISKEEYKSYKEYHNISKFKYINGKIIKKVIAILPNGKEIEFNSLTEAQNKLTIERHKIGKLLKSGKIHEKTGIKFKTVN